ncbi:MAG TPA: T9SS type A sorting domain-containing protein, partial [Candidatus Nitrosocosmicus sp.]
PVLNDLNLDLSSQNGTDFNIQIINSAGQLIYNQVLWNCFNTKVSYKRNNNKAGIYIIKVIDIKTGFIQTQKIVFQ